MQIVGFPMGRLKYGCNVYPCNLSGFSNKIHLWEVLISLLYTLNVKKICRFMYMRNHIIIMDMQCCVKASISVQLVISKVDE